MSIALLAYNKDEITNEYRGVSRNANSLVYFMIHRSIFIVSFHHDLLLIKSSHENERVECSIDVLIQ